MASKLSKTIIKGEKAKTQNYPFLDDKCIEEIRQASKLDISIRTFDSLKNTKITFKL